MSLDRPDTIEDWAEVQKIERDICYLYHQLSEYRTIMGDLYWGLVYDRPYWEYVNLEFHGHSDPQFMRDGCLVMIIAMALELLDGAGGYIKDKLPQCISAVSRLCPEDEKTIRLVEIARHVLDAAANEKHYSKEMVEMSSWVHKNYVREYFHTIAKGFESGYFKQG